MLERRVHSEEEEEEGEGGLEIDLDYNDYVSVSLTEEEEEVEQPLDLRVGRQPIKEERLLASVPLSSHSPEEVGKGTLLTEKDVISLIDPYIGWDRKRAVCTVCDIKFVKREKARAHVENKHLDCLQYKCPLCRASKVEHIFLSCHPEQMQIQLQTHKKYKYRTCSHYKCPQHLPLSSSPVLYPPSVTSKSFSELQNYS